MRCPAHFIQPTAMHRACIAITVVIVVVLLPPITFFVATVNTPLRINTVIAHRGNGFNHSENSIDAIKAAHAHGYPVEIDVRLSRDNVPVVTKYAAVKGNAHCTGGTVANKTRDELKACGIDTLEEAIKTGATLELDLQEVNTAMINTVANVTATAPPENVMLFIKPTGGGVAETIATTFAKNTIMWRVGTVQEAEAAWKVFNTSKDMYAVTTGTLWLASALMRYITSRTQKLNVYNIYARWMIMGMPVTHVEVDDPTHFNSHLPSPALAEVVYRTSAVGLSAAFFSAYTLYKCSHKSTTTSGPVLVQ